MNRRWYNVSGMMNLRKPTSRGIGIAVAVVVFLLVAFTSIAAPPKSIPPDEANPRLQTVLQELARTAWYQPQALPEAAKDHLLQRAEQIRVLAKQRKQLLPAVEQKIEDYADAREEAAARR